MTVKRVILIRPGETDWNKQGRWQGWVATPLNAHGRQQAEALARHIRNIGMNVLYSSDLKRATETAGYIARMCGFEPILDPRLRERSIGLWQGLTLEEMRAWYGDEYDAIQKDADGFCVPGGESRADVRTRVLAAFGDILAEDRGETVGVMTHTTTIKALLLELFPDRDPASVNLGNTSVTTLRRRDSGWELVTVDDCLHLEGLRTAAIAEIEAQKR
jgi:probable phosphoglycerate mutase